MAEVDGAPRMNFLHAGPIEPLTWPHWTIRLQESTARCRDGRLSVEYLLKNENGRIWAYGRRNSGGWSKAGKQVSQEEADRMVAAGEAEFEKVHVEPSGDEIELMRLSRFAAKVRRTGLSGGRDADLVACVKLGLLSESEAMNLDD